MNKPQSILDMRFFSKLYDWHLRYGALFTLHCYCFIKNQDYSISEIPQRFAKDFQKHRNWLRFGFHSCTNLPFVDETDYEIAFLNFIQTAQKLQMNSTNILRLHYWNATNRQKQFLYKSGIRVLLYPTDTKCFTKCGLEHWCTNFAFEELSILNEQSLCMGESKVVAFTHEWCFEQQIEKIEFALRLYKKNNYVFI